MNLHVLDQSLHYENNQNSVDEMITYLNNLIEGSDYVFSGIEVDGYDIYNDYYQYIVEHLNEIKDIKVKIDSVESAVNKTIMLSKQYLDRIIPEIEGLADAFYLGAEDNVYIDKLGQLLEGIQWLIAMGQSIELNINAVNDLNKKSALEKVIVDLNGLKEEFDNIKDAISNTDMVLIADILKYEIVELLEAISKNLEIVLGCE